MIFAISTFRFCSFYFGANRREDKTFLTLMQPRIFWSPLGIMDQFYFIYSLCWELIYFFLYFFIYSIFTAKRKLS